MNSNHMTLQEFMATLNTDYREEGPVEIFLDSSTKVSIEWKSERGFTNFMAYDAYLQENNVMDDPGELEARDFATNLMAVIGKKMSRFSLGFLLKEVEAEIARHDAPNSRIDE